MNLFLDFFKDDWAFYRYKIAKKINGFFYYLRKIPLIGKKIPQGIFAAYGLKGGLSIVLTIVGTLFALIKKIIILAMMVGIHLVLRQLIVTGSVEGAFSTFSNATIVDSLWLWFVTTALGMGFYNQFTALLPQEYIKFYTEFNVPRYRFILGQIFVEVIKQAVYYIPASLIYAAIIHNPWVPFFIFFSYLAMNGVAMLIARFLLVKGFGKNMRRLIAIVAGLVVLVIIWYSYSLAIIPTVVKVICHPLALVVWILLTVLTLYLAWNYRHQERYISLTVSLSSDFYAANVSEKNKNAQYIGTGLKMQEKLQVNHDSKVDQLKGSEYLNALLFSRYRQVFNSKLRMIGIGVAVVSVAIIALRIFGITKGISEEQVLPALPMLFFMMYFLSFGKEIVQMLFVNCDSSMLYYPFYREGKTILSGFTYRLRRTFYYNSIIVAGFFLLFLLLHLLNSFFLSWQFFAVLLLLLASLAFLFSFHELFIYYLLQPFTADMSVNSPMYKVITVVFYWISYMNIQVRGAGFLYVIVISAISLIYVFIGLAVIYKVAPKTFRIKD